MQYAASISTSQQLDNGMWDEIKVSVPAGTSIHTLLKGIYDATVKTTEADAKMAEAEWKRVTGKT